MVKTAEKKEKPAEKVSKAIREYSNAIKKVKKGSLKGLLKRGKKSKKKRKKVEAVASGDIYKNRSAGPWGDLDPDTKVIESLPADVYGIRKAQIKPPKKSKLGKVTATELLFKRMKSKRDKYAW